MKPKSSYMLGWGLCIGGIIIIIVNAVDYLAGWQRIPSSLFIFGIVFSAIGMFLIRQSGKSQKK